MKNILFDLFAVSLLFGCTLAAQAQEQQVVLLRNGTTLQGRVVREGNYYYVAVARGEIQLRASQVERVCGSLQECYQYRLGHLLPGDIHGLMELAQWCVEHGLSRQAQTLLEQVKRTHPQHPRLALLQRKLRLSQRQENKAPRGKTVLPTSNPFPGNVYHRHQEQEQQDLLRLEALAPQVVRRFTISVHRILQNRCAAGGCHGPGARNRFRLIRASQGRVSPRVVRHNLVQVLPWIDRRRVDRSELLHKALTPHGNQGLYQFSGLDKHSSRVLRQWLDELQETPQRGDSPSGEKQEVQKPAAPPGSAESHTVNRRLFQQQAVAAGKPGSAPPPRPASPQGATPRVLPVSRPAPQQRPRSPYDPAWFNRRFYPADPSPGGTHSGKGDAGTQAGSAPGTASSSDRPPVPVSPNRAPAIRR